MKMFMTQKDYEESVDKGLIHETVEAAQQKVVRYSQDHRKGVMEFAEIIEGTTEAVDLIEPEATEADGNIKESVQAGSSLEKLLDNSDSLIKLPDNQIPAV